MADEHEHKHPNHKEHRRDRLRDWTIGSYTDDGRAVSSLDDHGTKPEMPKEEAGHDHSGSADPHRRNK